MQKISLEEHIRQSQIAAQANKLKGNRHGQILSGLYTDPAHLIEELIQNAEDAYSRLNHKDNNASVLFELDSDGLHVFHNGMDFDENDLMAITTFAVTTKKGDKNINLIGKFGIGFRSVFGITDRPEIHSGSYNFCINDFEVLETIDPKGRSGYSTYIFLPFKKGISQASIDAIEKGLMNLTFNSMLFLNHINRLESKTPKGHLVINKTVSNIDIDSKDICIDVTINERKNQSFFRVYDYKKGQHIFGIAFMLCKDGGDYLPLDNQRLSVYFPTLHSLNVGFAVHGNFTTTPNREQVPISETLAAENIHKLGLLSTFIKKTIISESQKGRLNCSFFKLIAFEHKPIDTINNAIIKAIDEVISNYKILPGEHGGKHKADELCWPEDPAMRQLLQRKEIRLWFSRVDWLHADFVDQPELLHHLIKNHKLKKADNESFAFFIAYHPEQLQKKSIEWFLNFFRYLIHHPPLWNREKKGSYFNLRHKAIVPNQKRKPIVPFDQHDQALIHLGTSASSLQLVHPAIQEDNVCYDFLKMFGLNEAKDENTALEKILSKVPKITQKNAAPWLFELYGLYIKQDELIQNRIHNALFGVACIPCITAKSDAIILKAASDSYLPISALKQWFRFSNVPFVSQSLIQYFRNKGVSETEITQFLVFLNINYLPRRLETDHIFEESDLKSMRGDLDFKPIVKQTITDYDFEGMKDFFEAPSVRSAAALLEFINEMPETYTQGTYSWESYIRTEQVKFDALFIRQLRETACLPDVKELYKKPSELSPEELHPNCHTGSFQWDKLKRLLNFRDGGNQALSESEMKLIKTLRTKNIAPETLTIPKEEHDYPNKITLLLYKPMETKQEQKPTKAQFGHGQMLQFGNTTNSDRRITFEIPIRYSTMIFRYLSTERYANATGIRIKEIRPGYFHLMKENVLISYIFCSGFDTHGDAIVLDVRISELMKENVERNDVVLYIWEEGIQGVILHEIENIKAFLELHPLSVPLITTQW